MFLNSGFADEGTAVKTRKLIDVFFKQHLQKFHSFI